MTTNPKRKRMTNWCEEDKDLLKELVKGKIKIIEDKSTDSNTTKKKNAAWSQLTESFNSMSQIRRDTTQLRAQWSVMKMLARKEDCNRRQSLVKTGGGPPSPQPNNYADIRELLPNDFAVDVNHYDNDSEKMAKLAKISELTKMIVCEPQKSHPNESQLLVETVVLQDMLIPQCTTSKVEEIASTSSMEIVTPKFQLEQEPTMLEFGCNVEFQSTPLKEKKKLHKKHALEKETSLMEKKNNKKDKLTQLAEDQITKISEYEIEKKKELYELKLSNALKKSRNLDEEYEKIKAEKEYWQLKSAMMKKECANADNNFKI